MRSGNEIRIMGKESVTNVGRTGEGEGEQVVGE